MPTTINSTNLDFQTLKANLKTFLEQQSEFTDYDFEAAGLSNILDVLAANTHYQALLANMSLNETFLTTAQLRSSVIAHAESIGYTPRSKTSAVAYAQLSITNTNSGRSSSVSLSANTKFNCTIDNISYTFQTLESYTATDDGNGLYQFVTNTGSTSIPLYEGRSVTKTFFVGEVSERQIYVIPDPNLDRNTITVKVYDSPSSSNFTTYTYLKDSLTISSSSTLYDLHEASNGYWELHFGDGFTTGLAPTSGNKIVVTYISTNGEDGNGGSTFTPASTVSMDSQSFTLNVSTVSKSANGADKETIESIRSNAPVYFASQQRLVTTKDYESQILSKYGSVIDVAAWGGQDHEPIQYGKVMVSLKFDDSTDSDGKVTVKNDIVNNLTSVFGVISMDTVFIDPITTYVNCEISFDYNPNKSGTNVTVAKTQVLNTVKSYFETNLQTFGSTFRRSNILSEIDDISAAILNSKMDVSLERRFIPTLNTTKTYSIQFPVGLKAATSDEYTITSNYFYHSGYLVRIVNDKETHSTNLKLIDTLGATRVSNIGSYNPSSGLVTVSAFKPTSIQGDTVIRLKAIPANQSTIKATKHYLFEFNGSASFANGTIDYQD